MAALAEAERVTEEMVSLCRARARLRMRGQSKRALQIWQMLAQASRLKRQCLKSPTCQAKETHMPAQGAAEAPSRRKRVPECTRAAEGGSTSCQKVEPQPPRAGVEEQDHSALGECGEYLLCEGGGDRFGKPLRQALAAVRLSGGRSLSVCVCVYIHTYIHI